MAFHLIDHDKPRTFQNVVLEHLLSDEAENCVQLGLAGRMAREGYAPISVDELDRPRLWIIQNGLGIEMVAMQTLKKSMLVTRASAGAAEFLAECLEQQQWTGQGLDGVCPSAQRLATRYADRSGRPRRLAIELRLFQLRQVQRPTPAAGQMHCCGPADRERLGQFIAGLQSDIGEAAGEDVLSQADRLISGLRAFFWIDREPVAMALWGGTTPNGVRVTAVYTPPEFRCRGYATSLVACLSQHLLDTGRKFCFLFTDKANPISNSIYQKIGYEPVSERQRWSFDRPSNSPI